MQCRRALTILVTVVLTTSLFACRTPAGWGSGVSEADFAALATENGRLSSRVAALETEQAALENRATNQGMLLSYLATAMPTPSGMEAGAAGVEGSVVIEGGTCCVGGTAGDTVDIHIAYQASSPYAEVTETRVRAGGGGPFTEVDLAGEPWVPFVASQMYPFGAAINWVGFYVAVQYRDALGNLSLVYTDDISVEGSPPPPG
ncbi:MAG: hypothetical protein MUO38_11870 [Anaerolineales bacterium]|nr:hypothetical protein [Anaerolineales bacterium]